MKKEKIIFPLLALFVVGCGNNFTSKWPKEVADKLGASLGYDIPYIEAESYVAEASVDEYNEPIITIGCTFSTDEELDSAMDTYYSICDSQGYTMARQTIRQPAGDGGYYEFDCGFADLVVSDDFAIEIQFTIGRINASQEKEQLCIVAFTYVPVDENRWPTNLLEHYLGFDIPHYEFSGAKYESSVEMDKTYNVPIVTINVTNASETSEQEYYDQLVGLGYTIDDSSYAEGYGYYAYAKDNSHCIEFYYHSFYGLLIFTWSLEGIM